MDLKALEWLYAQVPLLALIMARVGALIVAAPVFGGPFTPNQVKVLLTLAISFIILPLVSAHTPVVPKDGALLAAFASEVLVGLSLGWFLGLFQAGVRMGGEMINRHAGFSAAENFDPDSDIGAGPMGDLFQMMFVLLFFSLDAHHIMIAAFARSYEMVPVGGFAPGAAWLQSTTAAVDESMRIALALSFPVLGAVMAITVAEGVLTRAVPQINLMQITFAIKIVVSVLVVWVGLPASVAFLGTVLTSMYGWFFRAIPLLG